MEASVFYSPGPKVLIKMGLKVPKRLSGEGPGGGGGLGTTSLQRGRMAQRWGHRTAPDRSEILPVGLCEVCALPLQPSRESALSLLVLT